MNKWRLFASIFQIVIGVLAIISYVIIAVSGEQLGKWTITLVLAISFVVTGTIELLDCIRSDKK